MEHTIIIKAPDTKHPDDVEDLIRTAIERGQWGNDIEVVEYHRERMLEEPDYGDIDEDQDPEAIAAQVEAADRIAAKSARNRAENQAARARALCRTWAESN
jgi:Arc/MetJ-type ribon-helix-helix transcriptional regulator